MPILRRILKYASMTMIALLVAAWLASLFCLFEYDVVRNDRPKNSIGFSNGSMMVTALHHSHLMLNNYSGFRFGTARSQGFPLGKLYWAYHQNPSRAGTWTSVTLMIPVPLMLTGILPLLEGASTGFRFRLWHYLAYTALVAVELAYYLRWQG
jgi:hypothetical protein